MSETYFSDRECGPRPRVEEEIQVPAWGGIVVIIKSLIKKGAFGAEFPEECPDGCGPVGNDEQSMLLALRAEIPDLSWPLNDNDLPPTLTILDLIEFCHRHVAKPIQRDYHSYWRLYHLDFNREEGQAEFRQKINLIFARNGLAFELEESGQVIRLAPPIISESLQSAVLRTGDTELDSMLETARIKYLDPDPRVRRESLEKLWDAWERLKTVEPGKDKKVSIKALLAKASPEEHFREVLEKEARELTNIGNNFQIRHSETYQTPIKINEHIDYLFHRLFAMIHLLLKTRDLEWF